MPPAPPHHLLLLPPSHVWDASAIASAVRVAPADAVLYVALAPTFSTRSRHASFAAAARLFASVYGAIHRAAEDEGRRDVDVRTVLLRPETDVPPDMDEEAAREVLGPVVPLEQLLRARPWQRVVCVTQGFEEGPELKRKLLTAGVAAGKLVLVDAAEAGQAQREDVDLPPTTREFRYIAVGGTFDHLHLGHKLLLSALCYLLSPAQIKLHLVVGISGDPLLTKKAHASAMEPWSTRCARTVEFMRGILFPQSSVESSLEPDASSRKNLHIMRSVRQTLYLEAVELHDAFGPTVTDENIEALVVTEETQSGGDAVNVKRRERGWGDLEVLTVGLVMAEGAEKMSSTEMRRRALAQ